MAQDFTPENVAKASRDFVNSRLSVRLMENYLTNAEERGQLEAKKLGLVVKEKIIQAIPLAMTRSMFYATDDLYTSEGSVQPPAMNGEPFIGDNYGIGVAGGYGSLPTTNFHQNFEEKASQAMNAKMAEMNSLFPKEIATIASTQILKELEPFAKVNAGIAMSRVRKPELRINRKQVSGPVSTKVGPFYYDLEVPPEGHVADVKLYYEDNLRKIYDFMKEIVVISQMWSSRPYIVRPRLFTRSVELLSDISYKNIVDAIFSVAKVTLSLGTTVTAIPGSGSSGGSLHVAYKMDLDLSRIETMLRSQAKSAVQGSLYRKTTNVIRQSRGDYRDFFGMLEEYIRYTNTGFRQ